MFVHQYVPKNFRRNSLAIIGRAQDIIAEYAANGLKLTLRQLYYQFVTRSIIPNNDKEYTRLGDVISDGRLAGMIDWEAIEDRTRNLQTLSHWDSPADIVEACADQFRIDRWKEQPHYVEVWVEKEALVSVLERACVPLDVPYIACKGYMSQTEMWAASQRIWPKLSEEEGVGENKLVTILHLGDHDPSGVDMTRDINDRLRIFLNEDVDPVMVDECFTVRRIALNMDQIRAFNPPPNPAKITDTRAASYISQYGNQSWELDAIEPMALIRLITSEVRSCMDIDIDKEEMARQHKGRLELGAVIKKMRKRNKK